MTAMTAAVGEVEILRAEILEFEHITIRDERPGSQYFVLLTRELLRNSLLKFPAHPWSDAVSCYTANFTLFSMIFSRLRA